MTAFTNRFRAALIFLGVLLGVALILVLLYLILKKDMCNCFGGKKKGEEEEEDEYKKDTDIEAAEDSYDDIVSDQDEMEDEDTFDKDTLEENNIEQGEVNIVVPVVTVTDEDQKGSSSKTGKKSALKSVLKKIARPINKVRFGGVTESEQAPLVESQGPPTVYDPAYSLGVIQRSDSMESFVSSVSAVSSANVEEFGKEVSPGRLQIVVEYVQRSWTLNISVKQADCLVTTTKDKLYWQVHVAVLPFKRHRFKTKYKSSSTPVFNQTFEVEDIAAQALSQLSVRFRVYGKAGTAGRKKLAGEVELHLSNLKESENKVMDWLHLKRKRQGSKKMESLV